VVQRDLRLELVLSASFFELVSSSSFSNLLHKRLELSELVEQGLVHDVGDVLDVVVDLVIPAQTLGRDSRIDALQDTQSSKIFESDLESSQCGGAGDELRVRPSLSRLHFLAHATESSLGAELGGNIGLDGLLLLSSLDSLPHGCSAAASSGLARTESALDEWRHRLIPNTADTASGFGGRRQLLSALSALSVGVSKIFFSSRWSARIDAAAARTLTLTGPSCLVIVSLSI
jgi:hypothetical protein